MVYWHQFVAGCDKFHSRRERSVGILNENAALVPPYSLINPPPFEPGSSGVGVPLPGADAVVCIAPGPATTYNPNWGQELALARGYPHVALAADDHYPNQVLARDCVVVQGVPAGDPRAVALSEFWAKHGYGLPELQGAWAEYLVQFDEERKPKWVDAVAAAVARGTVFFLALKEQPVIVLGRVDLRFQTSEGPTQLEHGMVVVVHPDDPTNVWALRPEKFDQRYNWMRVPSALENPRSS